MKRILFIDSLIEAAPGLKQMQNDRIAAYAKGLSDYATSFTALSKLVYCVENNELKVWDSVSGNDLASYDAAILGYWHLKPMQALALVTYLERKSVPFASREALTYPAVDKLGEIAKMADGTVNVPDSIICQASLLPKAKKAFGKDMNYPVVVKAAVASRGNDNFLVHSFDELKNIARTYKHRVMVLQEFIPNDSDYRVIVLNDKVRFVMRRMRAADSTSHLNNVSQGANAESLPARALDAESTRMVLRASELLNRSDFAGVDLMFSADSGKPYILEVNKNPDIAHGATQELVDEKIGIFVERVKGLL